MLKCHEHIDNDVCWVWYRGVDSYNSYYNDTVKERELPTHIRRNIDIHIKHHHVTMAMTMTVRHSLLVDLEQWDC